MDLQKILKELENCPCGQTHGFDTRLVEIDHGVTARVGELLCKAGFDKVDKSAIKKEGTNFFG